MSDTPEQKLLPNGQPARSASGLNKVSRGPSFDLVDLRGRILERAGVNDGELAELLRLAIATLKDGCTATKETVLSWEGQIRDIHTQPDYATRSRSARALLEVLGLSANKGESNAPVDKSPPAITVSISLGDNATDKLMVDVTPQHKPVDRSITGE